MGTGGGELVGSAGKEGPNRGWAERRDLGRLKDSAGAMRRGPPNTPSLGARER